MTTRPIPPLDRLITLHIPGAATRNNFGELVPGTATNEKVWARRVDLTASEQLELGTDTRITQQQSRIEIAWRDDVKVDQELTDDGGKRRRIIGIAELRRMWRLELLAEAVT